MSRDSPRRPPYRRRTGPLGCRQGQRRRPRVVPRTPRCAQTTELRGRRMGRATGDRVLRRTRSRNGLGVGVVRDDASSEIRIRFRTWTYAVAGACDKDVALWRYGRLGRIERCSPAGRSRRSPHRTGPIDHICSSIVALRGISEYRTNSYMPFQPPLHMDV